MNIALCLHGYFDSKTDSTSKGLDGYEYIKKHLLQDHKVDVFLHSWEPWLKEDILNLYNPVDYIFEEQINFDKEVSSLGLHNLKNCPRSPQTVLSHFYSIQQAFKLLTNNYDIVIKSRYDLGQINKATSPNNVECILFDTNYNMDRMNMAWWPDEYMLKEGPPDMWFYSNYKNMSCFKSIYNCVKQYMRNGSDLYNRISVLLGAHNISNASVLYKRFFEDHNLWDSRNAIECIRN